MNRFRMRKLLWCGVNPIEVSLMKFQDIKDGTGKDKATKNCALCYMYNTTSCFQCPLKEIGKGCKDGDSPYSKYNDNPASYNLNGMINALKEARVYELTGQKPVKEHEVKLERKKGRPKGSKNKVKKNAIH